MFCDQCGNKINETQKFCPNCGKAHTSDAQPKASMDIWLILIIAAALLLILSISMTTTWGNIPMKDLDIEDTLPSALLSIGALIASGFCYFREKSKKGIRKTISLILFIACVFMSVAVCVGPLLATLTT